MECPSPFFLIFFKKMYNRLYLVLNGISSVNLHRITYSKKSLKMKKIAIICILLGLAGVASAQSPIGANGKQLNFGVGIDGGGVPLYIGMDFGVHPDITVGGQLGLDLAFDYLVVAGRGDYHFNSLLNIPRDWDFYAGLNLGFIAGFDNEFLDEGLNLGAQIGGRYYWNNAWGINLEIGGGSTISGAKFGLSHRF